MSLVTTIHITVRQKGRFGDNYLGYLPINPGNFKICPVQVTHWYKLGSKPGKSSTKLRGDIQVSFQFLSDWSGVTKQVCNNVGIQGGMLKRSTSDVKIPTIQDKDSVGKPNSYSSKNKKEVFASLRRRSFRRKKSPAVQNCDNDFASFSSHSATSTPQNVRRMNSYMADTGSNSVSSISNGLSDSDTDSSVPQLPLLTKQGKGLMVSTDDIKDGIPLADKSSQEKKELEDATNFTPEGKMVSSHD